MSDLIEAIRADLATGTEGPWHVMERGFGKKGKGHYPTVYATDDELRYVAKCADFLSQRPTDNLANARRIARVPEMEAALLAAEELADALHACAYGGIRGHADRALRLDLALAAYRKTTA